MRQQHWTPLADPEGQALPAPTAYRVSFPPLVIQRACPVDGYMASFQSKIELQRHFCHQHTTATLCILEEGPYPLPQCDLCRMHVTPLALRNGHQATRLCWTGNARKAKCELLEQNFHANTHVFCIYGELLQAVQQFRYLGRPITSSDDDWMAVHQNLSQVQQWWGYLNCVLTWDRASPWVSGMFYKATVQAILLYSLETWTIIQAMLKALQGFHNRVKHRIASMMATHNPQTNQWEYPLIEDARQAAGVFFIDYYLAVHQQSFVDAMATSPIRPLNEDTNRAAGLPSCLY